jgi:hypothetical protein
MLSIDDPGRGVYSWEPLVTRVPASSTPRKGGKREAVDTNGVCEIGTEDTAMKPPTKRAWSVPRSLLAIVPFIGLFILVGDVDVAFADARWAVVNADGSLARGRNVVSSERDQEGVYIVVFKKDVTECAYVATAGSAVAGGVLFTSVTVAPKNGDANAVLVVSVDLQGNLSDNGFHLKVFC